MDEKKKATRTGNKRPGSRQGELSQAPQHHHLDKMTDFVLKKKSVQYLRPQCGSETGWTDRSGPREGNGQPAGSVSAGLILT